MSNKPLSGFILLAWLALLPVVSHADIPAIPENLAKPFDWQKAWGTIHLNSFADGLNDPGIPSTSNGVVACPAGANQCSDFSTSGVMGGSVVHGIKYDIKNSVVNCMSVQMPNCAKYNGGCPVTNPPYNRGAENSFTDGEGGVCPRNIGMKGDTTGHSLGDPYTLVYMPIYDSRSNDDATDGWQQLITNNCVRDIHAEDKGHGLLSPVSHVFSTDEKKAWKLDSKSAGLSDGSQMPDTYYYYQDAMTKDWIVSSFLPGNKDYVGGTLSTVDNYSADLAKIQAFSIADSADSDSFVVVDPSQFYDLRRYSYTGSPKPYANCPVLGLKMYDGICDPSGKAGCNLPIYGVGPTTTFTGSSGTKLNINNYPIVWSGYVLKWSFIKADEYWALVKNRMSVDGKRLYMEPVNTNPVMMMIRADAYCTFEEMTSDPTSNKTDLPCIQYIQYWTDGSHTLAGKFIDLYDPTNDAGVTNNGAAYVIKHDYNVNADGTLGTAVLNASGEPVTFFDKDTSYLASGKTALAVENVSPALNSKGISQPGVKNGNGSGIPFINGTSIAVQLNNQSVKWQGKDVNCLEFVNGPVTQHKTGETVHSDLFIPTNSLEEYQSFVDSVATGIKGLNVTAHLCTTRFKMYNSDNKESNPNGTKTWYGTTNCSQIAAPSCNQVTAISAQRYCQRSTGFLGSCEECIDTIDADGKLDPGASGTIASYSVPDSKGGTNTCFFKAYCHSTDACPGLETGGHVFCLAADTKITLADGSEKNIQDIRAGDEIMAFDAKHSKGLLHTAKVRATTVTKDQKLVQINDLKITPLHKIILANGRAVMAKDIKVGDTILRASGALMQVTHVEASLPPVTVFNLALDNADGYIAGGVRVLQYPIAKELVK